MDCPKCGTWNPDDKQVCWRCQTVLPKPIEKKQKKAALFMGLPIWAWVLITVMLAVWLAATCAGPALMNH